MILKVNFKTVIRILNEHKTMKNEHLRKKSQKRSLISISFTSVFTFFKGNYERVIYFYFPILISLNLFAFRDEEEKRKRHEKLATCMERKPGMGILCSSR